MLKKVLGFVSTAITALAIICAGTACIIWFYQPKTPKCLQ